MNTIEGTNSYTKPAFKYQLYDSLTERNRTFGYDYMSQSRLQNNHHNAYFSNVYCGSVGDIHQAPKDYYFGSADLRPRPAPDACPAQNMAPLDTRPNIYNDNVYPYTNTFVKPTLHRSWQPFTTTATPSMTGSYTQFFPHAQPCEVAPWNSSMVWEADLNAKLYERAIIAGAKEQPYSNWNRRQALAQLINLNAPSNNDIYTQKLSRPDDTFCEAQRRNAGIPPAIVHF
uniref:Uncharacterized protein n=1 Tax=viral metagenome TaxID=1070528 RepID=A0A6C0BN98_9ZZZZ